MASFPSLLALTPSSFTYVGIGTCPHKTVLAELDDVWDQLVPVFVRERLRIDTVRCIHFDPQFDYRLDFLKEYFATRHSGLTYSAPSEAGPFHAWTSRSFEVLVASQPFEHPMDDTFLEEMSEQVLDVGGKMVVQDFSSGMSDQYLSDAFQTAFQKTSRPDSFRKNILFDITYGEASCSTDMSTTRPVYDRNGNFINFAQFKPQEMLAIWGYDKALDKLTKKLFLKKFTTVLDEHHGNYRRRFLGSTLLYKKNEYNDASAPEVVMEVLQKELHKVFEILMMMGVVTEEKKTEMDLLFTNYKKLDMYHWNNCVRKLIL